MTPVVCESRLGDLARVGEGGQAVVLRVAGRLPGMPERMVLKRYRPAWLDGREAAVAHSIGRLVDLRQGAHGTALDRHSTWPLAVVTKDDDPTAAVGVLLRELPSTCYVELTVFSGTKRVPWELSKQLQSAEDLLARGLPVLSEAQRLEVTARVARFAALLHALGVVIGDFSARNVVLRRHSDGSLRPMLVDTDGCRLVGHGSHFPQGNTPDWQAPESLQAAANLDRLRAAGGGGSTDAVRLAARVNTQNQRSDVYKVALLVLRLFHAGVDHTLVRRSSTSSERLAAVLGRRRLGVVEQALLDDPGSRPTMADLAGALAGGP